MDTILTIRQDSVDAVVARSRAALAVFADAGQASVDEAVTALAWSVYPPERARELAELAVSDTGFGTVADKEIQLRRLVFGTLRDLLRVRSVGVIEDDPARGLVRYAKPVGLVAAVTPAASPVTAAVVKTMMAIKGRNAIVLVPPPSAWPSTARAVERMRAELARAGLPADLVQVLPQPATKAMSLELMERADLVVVTGVPHNIRQGQASGTPTLGFGAGNAPVIIDDSADLADAARKIAASKTFDNGGTWSAESALVILDAVYDQALAALRDVGGYRVRGEEGERIARTLWNGGLVNRSLMARDADVLIERFRLAPESGQALFFLVEDDGADPALPLSGDKLSLVLTVYRATDFDAAVARVRAILDHQGRGHSCGIHTADPAHARRLAEEVDAVHVLVNQAHTFGHGASFENAIGFSLSQSCGTWGGSSLSEPLNYRHFLNITHLVTPGTKDRPAEPDLFGAYWERHGR